MTCQEFKGQFLPRIWMQSEGGSFYEDMLNVTK